jgi:hypothetical protein
VSTSSTLIHRERENGRQLRISITEMTAEQPTLDHCFVIYDPPCGKIAGVATTRAIAEVILAEYIKTIPVLDAHEDMPIILCVPLNQRLEA